MTSRSLHHDPDTGALVAEIWATPILTELRGKRNKPPHWLVWHIASGEAFENGFSADLIFSPDKRAAITWVRARVCRLLRALGYSTPGIGRALNVDHSTVIHATKRDDLDGDPPKMTERYWDNRRKPPPDFVVPIELAMKPKPVPVIAKNPAVLEPDFIPAIPLRRLMGAR